ncbi:MAG: flagellar hook-basal body complex protein FliE [Acidobacteriota bacterium]
MNPISSSLPPITAIPRRDPLSTPSGNSSTDMFRALLEQSVRTVSQNESAATSAVDQFLSGEETDTHKMTMAVQRADLSFELFMQVRNKVVQAYQEVMRMPE